MIPTPEHLSRRDFLKLSGSALLSVLFPLAGSPALAGSQAVMLGRVTVERLKIRSGPNFQSEQVGTVRRDVLVDILEQVQGGEDGEPNRLWYRVGEQAYLYSGFVQPVKNELNQVVTDIPEGGMLGEISVPYADSLWALNRSPSPGPRLYYSSTHWVVELVSDRQDGSPWYKCADNLWRSHYYTRPEWVKLHSPADLAPFPTLVPEHEKWLEIILDEQVLFAYEKGKLVYETRISSGQRGFETPTGWFHTFHKRPTYHMSGGYDDASLFDLPGVPWDTYLTENGVAIHGTYWHNDFGTPHSHGCINLAPEAARWVYRWTSPAVPPGEQVIIAPGTGTRVRIRSTRSQLPRREP